MLIVGTAGHMDHGKTTLVKSLTGIDTDRLKEEKERGISIELGFAWLDLPDATRVGLIDVPGHEKFVHHMIAGATGVDLVLLVVAADEGVMPQTKEHIAICSLLGMKRGIAVLSKTDLVDQDWLALVEDDLKQYLAGTFLRDAPVLRFSSTWTGERLDSFRQDLGCTILSLSREISKSAQTRPLLMPIDRVFSIKGFGTVVTGTLLSGRLGVGEPVRILPSGLNARVRRLEIHGHPADESQAGTRTAVNLPDVATEQVARGDVLAAAGPLAPVRQLTATFETVPNLQVTLKREFKALFHAGSAMTEAAVRLLDQTELRGGQQALIGIVLSSPVTVLPGNPHIVRGFSIVAEYGKTVGGGTILWPRLLKPRGRNLEMAALLARGSPEQQVEAAVHLSGVNGVRIDLLPYLTPLPLPALEQLVAADRPLPGIHRLKTPQGTLLLHADYLHDLRSRTLALVQAYHQQHPRRRGMPREELKSQLPPILDRQVILSALDYDVATGNLAGDELLLWLPGFTPVLDDTFNLCLSRVEKALQDGSLQPPSRDAL
jgi:selenocysteine-specific elongation factor